MGHEKGNVNRSVVIVKKLDTVTLETLMQNLMRSLCAIKSFFAAFTGDENTVLENSGPYCPDDQRRLGECACVN